ncbi:MAG: glycosyl hydrolase family 28-related protein [Opitutales bacterium]|jgi:polygalacturonase
MSHAQNTAPAAPPPAVFDVRAYGATGDGKTLDSDAINRAIAAAAATGGGTVHFPAGTYLSYSIHLQSNITLFLDAGSTILAADPPSQPGQPGYDLAEPNSWGDLKYQDYGHSHWHNSLIWGENLQNISIIGPGQIYGSGLTRTGRARDGLGNKAIALKLCRNVILRDFSILQGGWFAILASGVDNFTLDNLKVDTNRDGFDIDCCRNVRVSNCFVNSPNDDGIVLKSSFALGDFRPCENVTITNCQVSGFVRGTFLDGTYDTSLAHAPDRDGPTGRIKFGTESNGGFKNIAISNCVFVHCRGLALETVDGGNIEDITISNIAMRDIMNSPIYIRIGARLRGPANTPVGAIRRVLISNVVVSDADSRYASIIAGLPGHPIEDVTLNNIHIQYKGGLTLDQVHLQPRELINPFFNRQPRVLPGPSEGFPNGPRDTGIGSGPGARFEGAGDFVGTPRGGTATAGVNASDHAPNAGAAPDSGASTFAKPGPRDPFQPPELEKGYPEPSAFGLLPAYGLYARHVTNLTVRDFDVSFIKEDTRPVVVLDDVTSATFDAFKAQRGTGAPYFWLRQVGEFSVLNSGAALNTYLSGVTQTSIPASITLPTPGKVAQP